MFVSIQASSLVDVFERHRFSPDQQEFYVQALEYRGDFAAFRYFVGNVDISMASRIQRESTIIGPPIGLSEFVTPLQDILLARSGDLENLSQTFEDMRKELPTTTDEIEVGRLGHYCLAPMHNIYQNMELSAEVYEEARSEVIEKISDYMTPESGVKYDFYKVDFLWQQEGALRLQNSIEDLAPHIQIEHDVDLGLSEASGDKLEVVPEIRTGC